MKIAIDGPGGAGKSTVAKMLAKKLNMVYLDTGAMYRAAALKAEQSGIATDDAENVAKMLSAINIEITAGSDGQKVYLDGKDVSEEIRAHRISKMASDISALPCVREYMVRRQRELACERDSVLDGRDIGTVVLPDADYKFFLTASLEERARRRHAELLAKGQECDYETVKSDIAARDYNDSHRAVAPLKKADDAVEIDSTGLTPEQVIEEMTRVMTK